MSTYSEKLKDPRWQKCRLTALDAAGWKCADCNSTTKTLNVHHRYYVSKRDPWHYPPACFLVLCETCHADHHNAEPDPTADSPWEDWENLLEAVIHPGDCHNCGIYDFMNIRRKSSDLTKKQMARIIDEFFAHDELFDSALLLCMKISPSFRESIKAQLEIGE